MEMVCFFRRGAAIWMKGRDSELRGKIGDQIGMLV